MTSTNIVPFEQLGYHERQELKAIRRRRHHRSRPSGYDERADLAIARSLDAALVSAHGRQWSVWNNVLRQNLLASGLWVWRRQ